MDLVSQREQKEMANQDQVSQVDQDQASQADQDLASQADLAKKRIHPWKSKARL